MSAIEEMIRKRAYGCGSRQAARTGEATNSGSLQERKSKPRRAPTDRKRAPGALGPAIGLSRRRETGCREKPQGAGKRKTETATVVVRDWSTARLILLDRLLRFKRAGAGDGSTSARPAGRNRMPGAMGSMRRDVESIIDAFSRQAPFLVARREDSARAPFARSRPHRDRFSNTIPRSKPADARNSRAARASSLAAASTEALQCQPVKRRTGQASRVPPLSARLTAPTIGSDGDPGRDRSFPLSVVFGIETIFAEGALGRRSSVRERTSPAGWQKLRRCDAPIAQTGISGSIGSASANHCKRGVLAR